MLSRIITILALALTLALPVIAATPVNINTADAAAIASSLDGIGPSKAQAIVAYRDTHGPFKSIEDLSQIKGIGPATLERNHDAILLADSADKPHDTKLAPAKKKSGKKDKTMEMTN